MAGTRRITRLVNGVLLLDKPSGMTSNAALQTVKRLYQAAKAGHTGSLDPLADGLLPICFGEATKISGFLLNADKTYRFRCRLGVTTDTGDAEGTVLERRPVPALVRGEVERVLTRFTGEIEQLPPMYSALKHQGQRLYTLARQGREVERQPRTITIHALRLLNLEPEVLECEVRCSKGTYIRTLAEDIGAALGCGGSIEALRRIAVAPYEGHDMVPLDAIRQRVEQRSEALDALLLPVDTAIVDWPRVQVDATCAQYLSSGQPVLVPRVPRDGWVRLYQDSAGFFGVGEILDDGRVALRRLVRAS